MEKGQNLVALGVRSVTNKSSKSCYFFIATRKATPALYYPSHQILQNTRHPPTPKQTVTLPGLSVGCSLSLECPSSGLWQTPSAATQSSFRGQVLCWSCSLPGSWYLGQRLVHTGAQNV